MSTEVYTESYVQKQLTKFRERETNHWRFHIAMGKKLLARYAPPPDAKVLDLGCSIGTFALEFALLGYQASGLDFDPKALEQAELLAEELGVEAEWLCCNAADFTLAEPVEIIVCFDLLEHLDDQTIAGALACVHRNLKPGGVFIFHTFPTEYDHIFYQSKWRCLPLAPFSWLPASMFSRLVRGYARMLDLDYLLRHGKTHQGLIASTVHPNPLSPERIEGFLQAAGFEIELLETGIDDFNPLKPKQGEFARRFFSQQPIAQRSIWGVARKPRA